MESGLDVLLERHRGDPITVTLSPEIVRCLEINIEKLGPEWVKHYGLFPRLVVFLSALEHMGFWGIGDFVVMSLESARRLERGGTVKIVVEYAMVDGHYVAQPAKEPTQDQAVLAWVGQDEYDEQRVYVW